jgi:uncharacterized membrane protein
MALLFSVFVLLVMDVFYINLVRTQYLKMITNIQGGSEVSIRFYGVALSYLFIIVGLTMYVLPYARKMKGTKHLTFRDALSIALSVGGVFGGVVYGVYNMTNLSLFKHFALTSALLDVMWGVALYTVPTLVYLLLVKDATSKCTSH